MITIFTTGVKKTIGFSEKNVVATLTKAIPVFILFLQTNNTIPYISNKIPKNIVIAIFPVARPTIQSKPIRPNDMNIIP